MTSTAIVGAIFASLASPALAGICDYRPTEAAQNAFAIAQPTINSASAFASDLAEHRWIEPVAGFASRYVPAPVAARAATAATGAGTTIGTVVSSPIVIGTGVALVAFEGGCWYFVTDPAVEAQELVIRVQGERSEFDERVARLRRIAESEFGTETRVDQNGTRQEDFWFILPIDGEVAEYRIIDLYFDGDTLYVDEWFDTALGTFSID